MTKSATQTDLDKITAMCETTHALTKEAEERLKEYGDTHGHSAIMVSVEAIRAAGPDQLVKWYDDFMATLDECDKEWEEAGGEPEPRPKLAKMITIENHDILVKP